MAWEKLAYLTLTGCRLCGFLCSLKRLIEEANNYYLYHKTTGANLKQSATLAAKIRKAIKLFSS